MVSDHRGTPLFEMEWTPSSTRLRRVADTIPDGWLAACTAVARDLPYGQHENTTIQRVAWVVLLGAFDLPEDCISIDITAETSERSDGYIWADESYIDDSFTEATRFVVSLTQDALERANFRWPMGDAGQMSAATLRGRAVWRYRDTAAVAPVGELSRVDP